MRIQLIQWNISIRSNPLLIADYIKNHINGPTIVNLQEVRASAFEKICQALGPEAAVLSLDLRPPGKHERKNRQMGVVTMVFGGQIYSKSIVDRSVFPERTLFVQAEVLERRIGVLNFHSLTGVSYKGAKSSNFASLADFIGENESQIDFIACDANEPMIDSMDDDKVVFFPNNLDKGHSASLLFGKDRVHGLSDALKVYHIENEILTDRTPILTSHKTGNNHRRYDFIYKSDKWKVEKISYPFEESLEASSDHSMVIGEFSLQDNVNP